MRCLKIQHVSLATICWQMEHVDIMEILTIPQAQGQVSTRYFGNAY